MPAVPPSSTRRSTRSGCADREVQHEACTHRVADVGRPPTDVAEEVGARPEVGTDARRSTVAGSVDHHHLVVGGEVGGHRVPRLVGLREAVDEHDSGADHDWPVAAVPAGGPRARSAPADVAATFCATLADEWLRCGVTDVVVAPGSRSTPLALAVATSDLRVHVHHDERSAGFVALGLGMASGRPAVVITTSGTAAVELHPAVVEASQGGVRSSPPRRIGPPSCRTSGRPRPSTRPGCTGGPCGGSPNPESRPLRPRTWRSLAAQAVAETSWSAGRTGPPQPGVPRAARRCPRPAAAPSIRRRAVAHDRWATAGRGPPRCGPTGRAARRRPRGDRRRRGLRRSGPCPGAGRGRRMAGDRRPSLGLPRAAPSRRRGVMPCCGSTTSPPAIGPRRSCSWVSRRHRRSWDSGSPRRTVHGWWSPPMAPGGTLPVTPP